MEIYELSEYLPDRIKSIANGLLHKHGCNANEIRLRASRPAVLMLPDSFEYICPEYFLTSRDLNDCFEKICDFSVFSHQNDIAEGFITLPGGHRVGFCGTAAYDRQGLRTVRYISSLNIRIAGEHIGCSDDIFTALCHKELSGVLIAGPPCSGKTTLLKDIALKLSSSPFYKKTVVIDERSELAAMYRGVPENTIGDFCDVLVGYPKAEGILLAVRTLSPEVIVCDEIGGKCDADAISDCVNSGVVMIASIHACNTDQLYSNRVVAEVLKSGAFRRIAFLSGGTRRCVLDCVREVSDLGG